MFLRTFVDVVLMVLYEEFHRTVILTYVSGASHQKLTSLLFLFNDRNEVRCDNKREVQQQPAQG